MKSALKSRCAEIKELLADAADRFRSQEAVKLEINKIYSHFSEFENLLASEMSGVKVLLALPESGFKSLEEISVTTTASLRLAVVFPDKVDVGIYNPVNGSVEFREALHDAAAALIAAGALDLAQLNAQIDLQ